MAVRSPETGSGLDACKRKVEPEVPICPLELGRVMTSDGAMSGAFQVGDFTVPHKKSVQVRGYVDFYGGYANHCREVITRLQGGGKYTVKLNCIPSPPDIHPVTFSNMNWFMHNPGFVQENSTFLVIAGPGHLQKKFLPQDGRRVIGWTMVETLDIQPEIAEWCNNADLILAPTTVDYNRFKRGGVRNVEIVHVGYDPQVYHQWVKPMDIANVRGRYVFGVAGSWNYRKGVESIVRAYCKAFNSSDRVSLLLVCKYGNRPHGKDAEDTSKWGIRVELKRCIDSLGIDPKQLPHICVLDIPLHPPVIPHVYSRMDCLVGFSSGESTWLPGLELTAIGKPIIQLKNDCCGYMDYMAGGRYLCKEIEYPVCDDKFTDGTSEYYAGQKMGIGNEDELSEMMERVFDEFETPEQKQEVAVRNEMIHNWQWGKCISRLSEILG